MQGNPHNVEGNPPETDAETAPGTDVGESPERQGPQGPPGPSDEPDGDDEAPSGPPESVPDGEGRDTSRTV